MNGNMMRVRCAVNAAFSGVETWCQQRHQLIGKSTMPATLIRPNADGRQSGRTLLASRHAASSPPRAMVLLKVVTNAVDSAPSANRVAQQIGNCEMRR